tara:strand:- start:2809 stop:3390 length:582 start_codon:yes stop_codon:yes gene_type:complete
MKFLQTILIVLTVMVSTNAVAQDTDALRGSADVAAEKSKVDADKGEAADAAEKVVEAVVAEGETLPDAEAKKGLEDGVSDMGEAAEVTSIIMKAFQDKNWAVFIGGILMLIIFLLNKFGVMQMLKLEGWGIAAFSVGLGVVSQVAIELTLLQGDVLTAILMGVSNGLVATGFWELVKSPVKAVMEPAAKEESA